MVKTLRLLHVASLKENKHATQKGSMRKLEMCLQMCSASLLKKVSLLCFSSMFSEETQPTKVPLSPESGLSWKAGVSGILLPCWTMSLTLALKARALLIGRRVRPMRTALLEDGSVHCQFPKGPSPYFSIFQGSSGSAY